VFWILQSWTTVFPGSVLEKNSHDEMTGAVIPTMTGVVGVVAVEVAMKNSHAEMTGAVNLNSFGAGRLDPTMAAGVIVVAVEVRHTAIKVRQGQISRSKSCQRLLSNSANCKRELWLAHCSIWRQSGHRRKANESEDN
jgi:hypothetical protein